MDCCDGGTPLAFSPDGANGGGCSERRASGDEREPAWSRWFVPFMNPDGVTCDAFGCPNVAAWVFVPGAVRVCEACYQRLSSELLL